MWHSWRRWFLLFVVLGVVLGLAGAGAPYAAAAPAAAKSVEVLRRDGDITILPNGDVRVVETWQVKFYGGPFHYAFREIPLNRVEDITDWRVSEGSQAYLRAESPQPYAFVLSPTSHSRKIIWYFPDTTDATRTFTLSYVLKGALWIDEQGDQFFWKFIERNRAYVIRHATVTVHLPGQFGRGQILTATYTNGRKSGNAQLLNAGEVRFQGGPFSGGTEWEIRVQWPHGAVSAAPPSWETRLKRQPWIDLAWWVFLFLLAVATLGGGFLLWYTRGRDPAVGAVPSLVTEPPSKLPPGMVGTLVDEVADLDDIMATLLDLAHRGILSIETVRKKGFLGTHEETHFVARQMPPDLLPFETALMTAIFGGTVAPGDRRSLESLKNEFYQFIPDIKRKLYQAVVTARLFPSNPNEVRTRYVVLAVVLGGVVSALYFPAQWSGADAAGGAAIVLGVIVSVAWLVLAKAMPRKTRRGALEAAKWQGFKRYLRELERHTSLERAKDLFDRYLPYATAFGLSKQWVHKFARVPDMPAPGWYTMYPGYGGGVSGGGGGGHMASPRQGAPSLDSMASGAFNSFSDIADSLLSTLNEASSTFVSHPSSSGGGGGFSGGGGGGFGGGGGSSGFG